jgi:hypothetical protein
VREKKSAPVEFFMCAAAAASGTEIVIGMGYLVDQLFFPERGRPKQTKSWKTD